MIGLGALSMSPRLIRVRVKDGAVSGSSTRITRASSLAAVPPMPVFRMYDTR